MKYLLTTILFSASLVVSKAQEASNRLLEFLDVNKSVEAEFVRVESDPSMEPYGKLIEEAQKKDPKWFAEHQKTGTPGSPLPYHEKLMTKEQYDAYLKSWDLRKVLPVKGKNGDPIRLKILLTKESNGKYVINIPDVPISLLQYSPATDSFSSMFGELKFLEKIDASPLTSLRAWSGYEWKAEKKDAFDTTRQNFAIGRTGDGKYGYLIYRLSQRAGDKMVDDKRFVLRFAPVKKPKK